MIEYRNVSSLMFEDHICLTQSHVIFAHVEHLGFFNIDYFLCVECTIFLCIALFFSRVFSHQTRHKCKSERVFHIIFHV